MLTGQIKTREDMPEHFHNYPRFQPGNFEINMQLVRQVEVLAAKKGCTPAQLAVAWVRALARRPGMPTIIPIPGATTAARVTENSVLIELTDAEMDEIEETLAKFEVAGERYPAQIPMNT
jgi:pyridoxine 4-dehydrogenase